MAVAFLLLLFFVSLAGELLPMGMGVLLALQLGLVSALFVTMPYGKFVHALCRLGALVRYHIETDQSSPQSGAE